MRGVLLLVLTLVGAVGSTPLHAQDYESLDIEAMERWKARDWGSALESFKQGLAIAQASGDRARQFDRMGWICSAYAILEKTSEALKCNESALQFFQDHKAEIGNDEAEERDRLDTIGSLYAKQGQYALALRHLRASLELCQHSGADCGASLGRYLCDLGIALYLSGDLDEAERRFRESVASSHAFAARVAFGKAVPTTNFELEALRWLERTLVAKHRTDDALAVSQIARAGAISLAFAERLGEHFSGSSTPDVNDIKAIARQQNATIVEYSVVYKSNPSIPLEFSDFELLPAASLYIWVVHPDGRIDFRETNFGESGLPIASIVKEIRFAITSSKDVEDVSKALQRAYQLLISPIEHLLPDDPRAKVLFVPQDTLYLLPFAAFQDPSGHYLLDGHTIVNEVSLETLRLSQRQFERIPKNVSAVLVVGNPTMPAGLPSLPGAESEARAVAGLFGTTALTGSKATKRAVTDRFEGVRILHFATHGLLNAHDAELSSLALAPDQNDSGFLRGPEISALRLDAELAVLSACDTGEGRLTGDGVVGLSRSFVQAGTPTLVVSLWSIPDEPTAALMVDFYKNVQDGQDKADALRMAMLATKRRFPAPRAWAAFTLLGVSEASPTLRTAHGSPGERATANSKMIFTIPDGSHDYLEDENGYSFETPLSLVEVAAFYRRAFVERGFREDTMLAETEKGSFSMSFTGQDKVVHVHVSGVEFKDVREISVRFEPAH